MKTDLRWPLGLLLIIGLATVPGCGSFGRSFNRMLPEFLRAEPGAEEIERFSRRQRVLNRSPEEIARARADFEVARDHYNADRFDEASELFELFMESYPDTAEDQDARFMLFNAYMKTDELVDARSNWKEYLDLYPISKHNATLEEIGYQLGLDYLAGDHDFLFFSKSGYGVELLKGVYTYFPNGPRADDARWRLANFYFEDDNWVEAQLHYDELVESYPDSEWASRAHFQRAQCRDNRIKGIDYDQKNMEVARRDFLDYLEAWPEGDRRSEAEASAERLRLLLAQKQVEIARWYIGQDRPRAARMFCTRVVNQYPGTQPAAEAAAILAELPPEDAGELPESSGSGS